MITPAFVRSNWAPKVAASTEADDQIEKGILFNGVSSILLMEKFFRVKFIALFLTGVFRLKPDIGEVIHQLFFIWETPFLICPLYFSNLFSTFTYRFNSRWMLHQNARGVLETQKDLQNISSEKWYFLEGELP